MDKIFNNIIKDCSDFLINSQGHPLYKYLETDVQFGKVKVRLKKTNEPIIDDSFNSVFKFDNLRQRAVFSSPITTSENDYYIFPKDNYRILYCDQVSNSTEDNKKILTTFIENLEDDLALETFNAVLKYTYKSDTILSGLSKGAEIIIYNIPYYYIISVKYIKYNILYKRLINGCI